MTAPLPVLLRQREDVQEKGVVAVLLRRNAEREAAVQVIGRIEAVAPGFGGEREIGDDEVEGLEAAVGCLEVRAGEGVVLPDLRRGAVVEDHVHPGQRGGGVVHFLPVEGEVEAGAALGLVVRLEQQRAGAAGGVVDGLAGGLGAADADDLGHDAGDFRRRVELPLALARLGGEVPHQVFVGVAEQVVAFGAVAAEVERRGVEDGDEVGEAVHHLLALAELVRVVEVGDVDHALEIVGLGELGDDLVHLVADLLVALERDHVGEAAALGHVEQVVLLAGRLVGDVLHEQQDEDVVLVLRGVHAAAQFVATCPEGGVEFGFLDGHASLSFSPNGSVKILFVWYHIL